MADQPVTREKLINADKDVQVIEDFIKKPKDETVTTRFGDEIMTLKGLEEEVKKSGGYFKRYATLAGANADIANIPVNSVVKITSEVEGGDYEKATAEATTLTKSPYDSLKQSKQYIEDKVVEYNLDNIKAFAEETEYESSDTDEYELIGDFKDILVDSKRNIISAILNNKKYYFLPVNVSEIDVNVFRYKGEIVNLNNVLDVDEKTLLVRINDSYLVAEPSDEYALNNKAKYVVLDQNFNILFDVQTYNDALNTLKQQSETLSNHTPRIVNVENKVAALAVNPYIPFIVSNNIFVQNINDFSEKKVTSTGVNHSPVQIQQDAIMWQSSKDTDTDGLYYAQAPNFVEYPLNSRRKIAIWGHSFTDSNILGTRIEALTNMPTYVFGRAGTTSVAIAAMQGGDPLKFNIVGGLIPASGAVNLTPYVDRLLVYASSTLMCSLAGVDGTLSRDTNGTQFIFTRASAGEQVAVTGDQILKVYPVTSQNSLSIISGTRFDQHDECINIFWLGRNNIESIDKILSNAESMINNLKTKSKKVVILADFPTSAETTGTVGANNVSRLNAALKAKYPSFYCEIDNIDILQNFKNHGTTAQDQIDVSNGITPTSLRSDNLHPNSDGVEVNAQFIYQFLQAKGWA